MLRLSKSEANTALCCCASIRPLGSSPVVSGGRSSAPAGATVASSCETSRIVGINPAVFGLVCGVSWIVVLVVLGHSHLTAVSGRVHYFVFVSRDNLLCKGIACWMICWLEGTTYCILCWSEELTFCVTPLVRRNSLLYTLSAVRGNLLCKGRT